MTYFRFHWIFNLPLLALLLLAGWGAPWTSGTVQAMAWVLLAVMMFTTPWDNLAARWGIWGFPREKYTLRLGYLPVEEYLFFLLQSVNVMLAARLLLHVAPAWRQPGLFSTVNWVAPAVSVPVWIVAGLLLRAWGRRAGSRMNYALHLAWFLPVIGLQWLMAPALLAGHVLLLAVATGVFGLYYSAADFLAVRAGVWFFDERQITGGKVGPLPWEEIAFFFLTSLLVAQSFLLLLPDDQR